MTTHNLSSELINICNNDISSIQKKYKSSPQEALKALDNAEGELEAMICNGIKEMKIHLDFDDTMPLSELISRMQEVDNKAKSVKSKDVSLIVAVFLSTIGCDYLSQVFHTKNILTDSKIIFENARVDLKKQIYAAEHQSKAGQNGTTARYKGQNKLVASVIAKWLDEQPKNIFEFAMENYEKFYDSSRVENAKVNDLEQMHKLIQDWLETFDNLIKGKITGRPRKIIIELAKTHSSTAL